LNSRGIHELESTELGNQLDEEKWGKLWESYTLTSDSLKG
jgi:hypothetical protein